MMPPPRAAVRAVAVCAVVVFYAGLLSVASDRTFSSGGDAGGTAVVVGPGGASTGADGASTAEAGGDEAGGSADLQAGGGADRERAGRSGDATGSARRGTASGGDTAEPAGGTEARDVPVGPGVTGSEIKIGFMVTANLQAGFAAIGASGQPPDEIDLYRALVQWVNGSGGIAGREVAPVFAEVDALGNWQAQAQAVCERFTTDDRVAVAVTSVVGGNDSVASCLSAKGVPVVEQNHWLWDQAYWDRLGHLLYQPSRMRPDRSLPAAMTTLARGGFFEDGHRLGLLRFDGPVFERLSGGVMKPAIAANGGNLVEEVAIATPGGAGDFGGMSAQIGNAIIRFRSRQVSHLLFLENAGIIPFFWNHEASSQRYYPRLGLLSNDLPSTQATQMSPEVLDGALAAGWAPSIDTVPDHTPPNPARDRCRAIMTDQGLALDSFGFYHSAACDAVFFLRQALDAAPALSADGLRASVERLGDAYMSPYTFPRTQLGPGRHDGATMMALAAYEETPCDCFRYTGPPVAVP